MTVVLLSIATTTAVPILFLTVCIIATIGGYGIGMDQTLAIAAGFLLATLIIGVLIFGMIRLGIWLLKPRQPHHN